MSESVLYFPYIRVPESGWFTRVLLYWDEVGSIVPSEYVKNPMELGTYMAALIKERQVKPVTPGDYIEQVPNFEVSFLEMLEKNYNIQERRAIALEKHETMLIHIEKFSSLVYSISDMGLARKADGPWWEMERLTADLYMSYLSSVLGKAEGLKMEPITDSSRSLSVFSASPEHIPLNIFRDLRMSIIRDILPAPTTGIPVLDLVRFKDKYRDLLHRFRIYIETSLIKISSNADKTLRDEEIRLFKAEIEDQKTQITTLMNKRHWPQIVFGSVAAAMPLVTGMITANPLAALAGLPPLAYAIYSAYNGAREKQAAILNSPLAYAALAQKRFPIIKANSKTA
jgi:hypothetical protein